MCRKYQRKCTRRAQTNATDTARPTGLAATGVRSACQPRKEPFHTHNASDRTKTHVPVIAMDYMYMNEMTDVQNSPVLVIHESCSEGVWAAFTKKKGDSAHVKNKVANIIRSLGSSKIVIKSDQERECGREFIWRRFSESCVVASSYSLVGESAANGVIENAIQRVQGQVRAIKSMTWR